MFHRLLIANRGEVAARLVRTACRLGITSVAVVSEADRGQAWLDDADEVVVLGPARPSGSYLDQDALLEVGVHLHCSAVHPGWGFLAENHQFALRCASAGLTFVGPSPHHLRLMGDKVAARRLMARLGLPVIPGSDGPLRSADHAAEVAERIGYPVLLKAVAGGGGRGMRAVDRPEDLHEAYGSATSEAAASFGDGRVYLERRIVGGRHVEVQIVADRYGTCLQLGERECSLQRRYQKVLEEAPSPALSSVERARILELVVHVVRRTGYRNAGTVELLLDRDGRAWFIEMNTRLQVEHALTEVNTGLDLVELQLRVAANEPLPLGQSDVRPRGHAIECRINAEDPQRGFRPSPGRVTRLVLPRGEGIRVDTHLHVGDHLPAEYDSMVAKVVTHGRDRAAAIARMRDALADTVVEGVSTNLFLQRRILEWAPFQAGRYDTGSLERELVG